MHEAGIARSIAATLRDAGLQGRPFRVLVTGGHAVPADFDAALLANLEIVEPPVDSRLVEIVHLPTDLLCAGCGSSFRGPVDAVCPRCGGPGLAGRMDEVIEIESLEGPGSSDTGVGDGGPSLVHGHEAHPDHMEPSSCA